MEYLPPPLLDPHLFLFKCQEWSSLLNNNNMDAFGEVELKIKLN